MGSAKAKPTLVGRCLSRHVRGVPQMDDVRTTRRERMMIAAIVVMTVCLFFAFVLWAACAVGDDDNE